MTSVLAFLQNLTTIAFVLLGVAVGISWARHRDRSQGFLALAIVLLSLVSLLGRIPAHLAPMLLAGINLILFVGSAYALLRFRGSLIPLPRVWHAAVVGAIVAGLVLFIGASILHASTQVQTFAALLIIVVWGATVLEPIARFWLVARGLPAVQAWRLRSLSLGFAGIVGIILFAVGAALVSRSTNQAVQLGVQLVVLAIIPLLYVSFSPPAWLRREWRASEEEGLRTFMEELLISDDRDALSNRALDWSMRLVGGGAAASFDANGALRTSRGLHPDEVRHLSDEVGRMREGVDRVNFNGADRTALKLPIEGLAGAGALVVLAGPFTPAFGSDEIRRVQQFMSAFATALDRLHLIAKLEESNRKLLEAAFSSPA